MKDRPKVTFDVRDVLGRLSLGRRAMLAHPRGERVRVVVRRTTAPFRLSAFRIGYPLMVRASLRRRVEQVKAFSTPIEATRSGPGHDEAARILA